MRNKISVLLGYCCLITTVSAEAKKKISYETTRTSPKTATVVLQPRLFVCYKPESGACTETKDLRVNQNGGIVAVEGYWSKAEISVQVPTTNGYLFLITAGAPGEVYPGQPATFFRLNFWEFWVFRKPVLVEMTIKRGFDHSGIHYELTGRTLLRLVPEPPPAQIPAALVWRTG